MGDSPLMGRLRICGEFPRVWEVVPYMWRLPIHGETPHTWGDSPYMKSIQEPSGVIFSLKEHPGALREAQKQENSRKHPQQHLYIYIYIYI
jgi:hypothetical protein